jgi:hypothetical protein
MMLALARTTAERAVTGLLQAPAARQWRRPAPLRTRQRLQRERLADRQRQEVGRWLGQALTQQQVRSRDAIGRVANAPRNCKASHTIAYGTAP